MRRAGDRYDALRDGCAAPAYDCPMAAPRTSARRPVSMRTLFSRTWRASPGDVELAGHRLLLRAGFVRQLGAGLFSYLPLAQRSLRRIETILRQEIDRIGGQEISMPVVNPASVWQATGRWQKIGAELARLQDREGRDLVLAMTHEEVIAALVRDEVRSYKQLPQLLYHIQTKFRDDPRPRGGLMRAREFTMKDSYSLDRDEAGLDRQYRAHCGAYRRIFGRCGLPVVDVDAGMMGGSGTHEFMYLTPIGEDAILSCPACGYRANRRIARCRKPAPVAEPPDRPERVHTPGAATIAELCELLAIPAARTAKAVLLMGAGIGEHGGERLIFALVRGDMDVNEVKLAQATGASALRPATEAEIRAVGAVPGYASPADTRGALTVVDDLIPATPNLVSGANEPDYHVRNLNHGRDFHADVVADIVTAEAGAGCPSCSGALALARGVEVGHAYRLGTWISTAVGCTFLDADGAARPVVIGSYGIGVGRLLACVAEEHHDSAGLRWPITAAPFDVHVVALRGGEDGAARLAADCSEHGLDVLMDDRDERPGVKFNDADLIGVPVRMTVSARTVAVDQAELQLRRDAKPSRVPLPTAAGAAAKACAALHAELTLHAELGAGDPPVSARA